MQDQVQGEQPRLESVVWEFPEGTLWRGLAVRSAGLDRAVPKSAGGIRFPWLAVSDPPPSDRDDSARSGCRNLRSEAMGRGEGFNSNKALR